MLSENQISIADKIVDTTNSIQEKPIEEIREQLISLINELIDADFYALVQLLYRIDVDEKKLRHLLEANASFDSPSIIADLIISRQLQKIALGKHFKSRDDPGADDSW